MKYKIIKEYSSERLERVVNEMMGYGYKPQGGVTVIHTNSRMNDLIYMQALVNTV